MMVSTARTAGPSGLHEGSGNAMVKARGARRSRLSTSAAALAAALAAGLFASSACAQTDPAKFRAFLASDLYKAAFGVARDAIPPSVLPPCPDLSSPDSTVTITKDVTFAKNGQPRSGAWWSRSPVSGCGIDTVINIFFSVGERGRITPVVALPGTTNADLVLQRDALLYAFTGVKLRMENCPDLTVTNTKFEAFGPQGSPPREPVTQADARGPWWETWTVRGCGRSFTVPLEFIPDATGTTINQSPSLIREG